MFGQSRFYGTQRGPTSPGRTWLLDVTNVSVTPYTYTEDFTKDDAVLSRDNLKISFRVHTVWRVDDTKIPLFMERYSTTVAAHEQEREPDAIVKVAYANFVREPLKTYARDEVQRRNGLDVKEALIPIGDAVLERIRRYAPRARSSSAAWWSATCSIRKKSRTPSRGSWRRPRISAHGHRDRIERKEHAAGSPGAGHCQRDGDYPRPAQPRCTSSMKPSRRRS